MVSTKEEKGVTIYNYICIPITVCCKILCQVIMAIHWDLIHCEMKNIFMFCVNESYLTQFTSMLISYDVNDHYKQMLSVFRGEDSNENNTTTDKVLYFIPSHWK